MIRPAPELMEMESLGDAAECLKTLAHPHRLRIVQMLSQGDHTVGELAEACQIPSHTASEHLRLMKDRGMLRKERDGHRVFYKVAQDRVGGVMQFVESYFKPEAVPTAG